MTTGDFVVNDVNAAKRNLEASDARIGELEAEVSRLSNLLVEVQDDLEGKKSPVLKHDIANRVMDADLEEPS